jgi:hypothetical protein
LTAVEFQALQLIDQVGGAHIGIEFGGVMAG